MSAPKVTFDLRDVGFPFRCGYFISSKSAGLRELSNTDHSAP